MRKLAVDEDVLVLYASQRGTAEKQAEEIARQMPKKLNSESVRKILISTERSNGGGGSSDGAGDGISIKVTPKLMGLDDFLDEREGKCRWTRLVVIVASSYGAGGAPMNARKFRRMCDGWIYDYKKKEKKENGSGGEEGKKMVKFLDGVHFAMLGLGDKYYKTYMMNPMAIQEALEAVGATLVGERGEADADPGEERQLEQMQQWMDGMWLHLAEALVKANKGEPLSEERIATMQRHTEQSI